MPIGFSNAEVTGDRDTSGYNRAVGRKPGGYKRPRGKVIESRGSPTALSNFAAKGSKGTRGQPVEEVESQGVFVLFCFPFKWEMWHVCVVVE